MSKKKGSAETDIELYLRATNRPYSLIDIVNNLKEHGKTAAQKALDNLVEDGKVKEKTYGKQKVYVIDQSSFTEASPEELKAMESKIEQLELTVKDSEASVKEAQAQLKGLLSSITTEDARSQVLQLRKEVEDLKAKHKTLSENTVKIDAKERADIRKQRDLFIGEWRSRKRRCNDMIATIMESYPKKKQDLYEELGVETDEEVNAVLPK